MPDKNIDTLFAEEIEPALTLCDENIADWNSQYFHQQKSRYAQDLASIKQYCNGGRVLEVGSVPCHMTCCLQKTGFDVTGLDLKPDRVKGFIDKFNLRVSACDIERDKFPFDDGQFSFVVFTEVFEHLRIDPIFTIKEIHRVLKPDGLMYLTTPNVYAAERVFNFILGIGLYDPYKEFEKLYILGHMGHVREYAHHEVKQFLKSTGFEVLSVQYRNYQSSTGRKVSGLFNFCYKFIPKLRGYQTIIAKKF